MKRGPFERRDQFYVAAEDVERKTYYLHKDGKWRGRTFNENDEPTGYFASREEAEQAIRRWQGSFGVLAAALERAGV